MTEHQKILDELARTPGITALRIADRLDVDVAEVEAALRWHGADVTPTGSMQGHVTYQLTDAFLQSPAGVITSARVDGNTFRKAHPNMATGEQAFTFLSSRGPISASELHALLGLAPNETVSAVLRSELADGGRVTKLGKNFMLRAPAIITEPVVAVGGVVGGEAARTVTAAALQGIVTEAAFDVPAGLADDVLVVAAERVTDAVKLPEEAFQSIEQGIKQTDETAAARARLDAVAAAIAPPKQRIVAVDLAAEDSHSVVVSPDMARGWLDFKKELPAPFNVGYNSDGSLVLRRGDQVRETLAPADLEHLLKFLKSIGLIVIR